MIEFETKVQISSTEYDKLLLKKYNYNTHTHSDYYFDLDNFFKEKKSALRIRKINNSYHLTLKTKKNGYAYEDNFELTKKEAKDIIETKIIDFGKYIFTNIPNIHIEKKLELAKIQTIRHEFQYTKETTIFIDQTTFDDYVIDFEIECESLSLSKSKEDLEKFILQNNLKSIKKNNPKIARYHHYLSVK